MVSAAAKKRQQKKKTLRKNQNIQASKSITDLNELITNDSDTNENSKELGDQELEDLLNEEIEPEQNQSFHVKHKSGSNYTFFNDADAKNDANDLEEDLFGDDIDLLLSDEELDLGMDEEVHEEQNDHEISNNEERVSQDIPEVRASHNRNPSTTSQKGTAESLERYATKILGDVVQVDAKDTTVEPIQHESEIVPELQEVHETPFTQVETNDDDLLLEDEIKNEQQDDVNETPVYNAEVTTTHEVPEVEKIPETVEEDVVPSATENIPENAEEDIVPDVEPEEVQHVEEDIVPEVEDAPEDIVSEVESEADEDVEENIISHSDPEVVGNADEEENIAANVEQIPDTAVVTAEYDAEDNKILIAENPTFEVESEDTHNELEHAVEDHVDNSNPNAAELEVPDNADEHNIIETQPSVHEELSDEDFFNNISSENHKPEDNLAEVQDQKENDLSFFDQLSAPKTVEKATETVVKEEPLDDAEFFNNLNTPVEVPETVNISDDDSLLEEEDSILLSENEETENLKNADTVEKRDTVNTTVIQTPMFKEPSEDLINDLIDSDLLDEDSLLDSDEELDHLEEPEQPVVQTETPKKVNKYAPKVELSQTPVPVQRASKIGIEPTIIKNEVPIVQPTLNIIKPQIIAPNNAVNESQKPPMASKYRTEKHKTDAYDFPVDLVSKSKPPAKAKAIKTANIPQQSFANVPVSETVSEKVASPPVVLPSIPVNPYAVNNAQKPAAKRNTYAPQAMINPLPNLNTPPVNSGTVPPPVNIVNQQLPVIPTQPHMNVAPPANIPRAPIPASNTDLPFDVAPPKAVPRVKPQINEPPKNPPINTSRARAVSNVSASSLSSGIYSPNIQNPNPAVFDSASANFPGTGLVHQRLPSRSSSMNKQKPILGDNKPKNVYAPSFQNVRRNSNSSFSPVTHAMGIQTSNIPQAGSPGLNSLQTVGLNNSNNPLSPITPSSKVSHARSHSSVYAPKKNQGAASKYAPTVHPSVQQAFAQQQMEPPINEVPNESVIATPVAQKGHSRTSSYMPPAKNAFAPQNNIQNPQNPIMPVQQFGGQQQFGFPNNMNNQPVMNSNHGVQNNFAPNPNPSFQQPPKNNTQQFSQFPTNTLPVGNQTQPKASNVLPITNPEELNKKQFPIVRWSVSGNIVSLKTSQYQNLTNTKIQPQGSVVTLPKHFLDFPGVLVRGRVKSKTLQPWLNETCEFLNGDSAYDIDGKVMWNLMKKKIELMDEKASDVTQFSAYAPALYDPSELNKFIENNKSNSFTNNQFQQQQNIAASKLDSEGLAQVLTYLRVGEHSEALSIALKCSDFSMSMVIASLIGKEKWTEVVDLYLKREFQGSGPDSEFAVNLLSSIFQVYIGNGKSLIDDFNSNDLKKNWALNNWNIILASVLSNSKSGTDVASTNNMLVGFLVDMGIFLSQNDKTLAAECCFILADVPLSYNEIIPGSNIVFSQVGAPNSLDGMLLSDLYEYSHKSAVPKFSGFLTLIGSKISHAEVLFLQKQYAAANKLLDVCTQMNKELMKTGNAQLKYIYTIDKLRTIIDSKNDSWIAKPTLSGVWGTLDKSFNKLIGGDNIDEGTDDTNSGTPKLENKLFDTFDAANSKNVSAAEANKSFDFSQGLINNRAPHLNNNLGTVQSEPNLFNDNAHMYQYNKNKLTKSAINNMKQESVNNMPPGPPSLSSVASSEHFNQQVANNLAKVHSHSRNQSVDSLLSFAPSNQRLNANAKRSPAVSNPVPVNPRLNEYNNSDTVIKKPLKRQDMVSDNFTEADKPPNFFPSSASNRYSPVKKSEESYETKKAVYDDIQSVMSSDHVTDMFLNKNENAQVSVNSPPKTANIASNTNTPTGYTFPHENKQSTDTLPFVRNASDLSPHTSKAPPRNTASFESRFNLESNGFNNKAATISDLPIPKPVNNNSFENSGISQPPTIHTNHSSLASPIKTESLQKEVEKPQSRVLDSEFDPSINQFNPQLANMNQSYVPMTPHQQQFNRGPQSTGWTKSHSRSSSQILSEMTGLNNNNVNQGLGGSVYTSRNVSIDSNINSSEPVIRQIRSSSVVFTPDSKRLQSEKVLYEDIVEEDEENEKQSSKNEAMMIEKKLAEAREKAEIEKKRKESEAKKQKDEEAKSKNDKNVKNGQENGWFGWLKANNNPNEKKAIKAKLGQKNQFYYDEKLKRWVNKNATEEEKKEIEAEANSAPPPPPVIKKKSVMPETKPRSGSVLGGPTQRTMGVMPPKNPITGESLIPETEPDRASFNNANVGSIVVQKVDEETESAVNSESKEGSSDNLSGPGTERLTNNTPHRNLTSSTTGLDDLLSLGTPGPMTSGPPSAFGSRKGTPSTAGARRNKKANRGYVNVMDHM